MLDVYNPDHHNMNHPKLHQFMIDFYLDYWNDFLTTEGMASYYDLPVETVNTLIKLGRRLHDQKCERMKANA